MDKIHLYYVYILTTIRNSVLYTGKTNDLYRRCSENKKGNIPGFTKKYNVNKMVFYEIYDSVKSQLPCIHPDKIPRWRSGRHYFRDSWGEG